MRGRDGGTARREARRGRRRWPRARVLAATVLWTASAGASSAQEPTAPGTSGDGYGRDGATALHCETAGSGPPVLLVHGGVTDLTMWDAQVRPLSRRYRVIRCDLRGFGRSPAPAGPFRPAADLRATLDRLGVDRAHVAGASLGGAVAVDFALAYPDRVASLVLPEPAVAGWRYSAETMRPMVAVLSALEAGDRERAVQAMLGTTAFAYARAHNPTAFAAIEAQIRKNLASLRVPRLIKFEEPEPLSVLGRITAPTLVLTSEAAGPDAERIAETLVRGVPGAERGLIEDSGHMMNLERPDAFNRTMLDFLERVESADPGGRVVGSPQAAGSPLPGRAPWDRPTTSPDPRARRETA